MAPTLAFAGKGGVGKTTLAGTLARLLARRGQRVVAVDGDLNPNLGISLGLGAAASAGLQCIPQGIAMAVKLPSGESQLVLRRPFEDILAEYGADTPDGVRLLVMGRPDHAGFG